MGITIPATACFYRIIYKTMNMKVYWQNSSLQCRCRAVLISTKVLKGLYSGQMLEINVPPSHFFLECVPKWAEGQVVYTESVELRRPSGVTGASPYLLLLTEPFNTSLLQRVGEKPTHKGIQQTQICFSVPLGIKFVTFTIQPLLLQKHHS